MARKGFICAAQQPVCKPHEMSVVIMILFLEIGFAELGVLVPQ